MKAVGETFRSGYEALERYPALLQEVKTLQAAKSSTTPEGLTSGLAASCHVSPFCKATESSGRHRTGMKSLEFSADREAMKLSDASLGKFDADESRLAYLEMQKSAEEARNKNRSALSFGTSALKRDRHHTVRMIYNIE